MTSVTSTGNSANAIGTTFSSPPLNQLLNQITTIKLDRGNFLLWKNLALPILRSYKLEGHLSESSPCPEKFVQAANVRVNPVQTEAGASSSMAAASEVAESILVVEINPLYESWVAIDQLSDYLRIMKNQADNLGQAGSPVNTRSLISQVLLGLDEEYNPVVAMIQGRVGITWSEMQAELLVFEKRLELQDNLKSSLSLSHGASVNMASSKDNVNQRNQNNNGRTNSFGRGYQRGGGGRGRGRARGYESFNNKPVCQVCGKMGHTALMCYQRFNKEFSGPIQNQNKGGNVNRQNTQAGPNQPSAFVANQNMSSFVTDSEHS